jgi:hypothetical protein
MSRGSQPKERPKKAVVTQSQLSIRLQRKADGSAILTCTRADGSVTWQRQAGQRGSIFPAHDLTHYAVETELVYAQGFYGLIAAGWEISDFAAPWPRGAIPSEAREVELLVGLLDSERRMGESGTAEEFFARGESYAAARRAGGKALGSMRWIPEEDLTRVRSLRDDLLVQWAATRPGQTLELNFQIRAPA